MTYDKNGREVLRKFGNGTSEETLYDRAGRVTEKMQKDYCGERSSITVNSTLAAQTSSDYGTDYFATDLLGSISSVTSSTGSQKASYTYDAFGSLVEGDLTVTTNFGYLGKQLDSTAALYNYGYRDYNSLQTRFTTVDPIRDGHNWFTYCNSDPVNFVDLWGLCVSDNDLAGVPPQYRKILQEYKERNAIHGHLLRVPSSYTTVNGNNKEKRGMDLLIIENPIRGDSVKIPVSSIANLEGTELSDSLTEGDFTLTYDPHSASKYAPDVFTVSSGTLIPKVPYTKGEVLKNDGTTDSNSVPWRGHNTQNWGSAGCLTEQTDNENGDWTDVIQELNKWGITDKFDIPMSFGLGTK